MLIPMSDNARHGMWSICTGVTVGALSGIMALILYDSRVSVEALVCVASVGGVMGGIWKKIAPHGTRWTHGALMVAVLGHVWLITLQALPSPGGGMSRRDWKSPTVQGEFKAWTQRLNSVGWTIEQRTLEDGLWDLAKGVMRTRKEALYPFYPYYRNSGAWQSWRMFVAPHRYPSRLHIDVKQGETWTPIYVARSQTLDWHSGQLNHDRFRAALFRYGWGQKYPNQWRGFVKWVANEVSEEFPEASYVRVRFWSYKTQSPEDVRSGVPETGRWHRTSVLPLENQP